MSLDPVVYTVPQLAEMLQISRGSAYQLANSKDLRTVRVGRRLLVPASAVEEFLGSANPGKRARTLPG